MGKKRGINPSSSSKKTFGYKKATGRTKRQERKKRREEAEKEGVETVEENPRPRTAEKTSTKGQSTGRRLSKAKEGKKAEEGKSRFSVAAVKSARKAANKQRNDEDDDFPSRNPKKRRKRKGPESVSRTRRDSTSSGRGRQRKKAGKERSGPVDVSSDESMASADNDESSEVQKKGPPKTTSAALLTIISSDEEGPEKRRHLATKSRGIGSGPLPTGDESSSESDINEPPGTRARNKKVGKANGPESQRQRSPSFPPPAPFPADGQVEPRPPVRHSFAFRVGEEDGVHLHEPVPPFMLPYLSSLYHPPAERLRFTVDVSGGKESRPIPVFSDDLEDRTPPTSFKYIATSILKTKELAAPLPRSLITCSCEGECVPETCQCASLAKKKGFQQIKNGKMEIKAEEEYGDVLLFACGPACGCPPNCAMRLISTVSKHDLELFKRKENNVGFGVRTRSFIGKGEIVMEFAGEVLEHREMGQRPKNHLQYAFCFYDSDEKGWKGGWVKHIDARIRKAEWPRDPLYIDPTRQGNIGRFISNGCDGNLNIFRVVRNDLRVQNWRPFFVAKRDILPSEELFWDYGELYKFADGITCRCNAVRCQHSAINRDLKYVSKEARMGVAVASTLHHAIVARNGLRDLTAIREPEVPPHKFNLSASLGIAEPVAATGRGAFDRADQFLYEKAADLAWKDKSCVKGPSGKPCKAHKDKRGFSLEQIEELRRNLQSFRAFRTVEPIPEVEGKAPVADEEMEDESEEEEERRAEKEKAGRGRPKKK